MCLSDDISKAAAALGMVVKTCLAPLLAAKVIPANVFEVVPNFWEHSW